MKVFFAGALLFRLITLAISVRHEKLLKRAGAVEYGARNSLALAVIHTAFYVLAGIESFLRGASFDAVSRFGLVLYAFGVLSLLAVMRLLGRFWTVKLLLAPDHTLVTHPLFRLIRHPNYYLNLFPEVIGLAITLHAWFTLFVGLLLYPIPLSRRIREEERVMGARFAQYQ